MSSLDVPVRNLVVEWRYAPNLAVYAAMDQLGIEMQDVYPDWQRSALTLELRDKKHCRRFVMAYNRTFFHVVEPSNKQVSIELDNAIEMFEKLSNRTSIQSLKRVGLRQWAAFPEKDDPLERLTARMANRFQPDNKNLLEALSGTVEDLSYVVDVKHNEGWKYALRAGPMPKKQWFEAVPHEESAFASPEAFAKYKDEFPETIFFVDMDASKEDVPYTESKMLLRKIRSSSHEIFQRLNAYLIRG